MATKPDLDKMPMDELLALRAQVDAAIAEKADARRKELQAELDALDEATGRAPIRQASGETRRRGSPAPKYRSKANPDLTWTGRGADPNWLKAEMQETGQPKSAFLIEKAAT